MEPVSEVLGVYKFLIFCSQSESLITGGEDSMLAVWPGKEPRPMAPSNRSAATTPTSATTPTTPTAPSPRDTRKRRAEKRGAVAQDNVEVTKRMQRMKVNPGRTATVK